MKTEEIDKNEIIGDPGPNPWMDQIKKRLAEEGVEIDGGLARFLEDFGNNPAPASSKYHCNRLWGTWEHNYKEMCIAFELNRLCQLNFHPREITETIFAHDGSKFLHPAVPNIGVKGHLLKDLWTYAENEGAYMPHAVQGLLLGKEYFKLQDYQEQAILYHMGHWDIDLNVDPWPHSNILCTFTKLIMTCDFISAHLVEPVYVLKK